MKVKHWAGYGTVNAVCKERKPNRVTIEVTGNHERGLKPRYFDRRDWERWIGKRFRIPAIDSVEAYEWWSDKDRSDHMTVTIICQNGQ